jgi:NitT/TauT family transport system substrate-binding protein
MPKNPLEETKNMKIRAFFQLFLAWQVGSSLLLSACQPASTPVPPAASVTPAKLRFAVLPILESLPMYVAEKEGLFEKHQLKVELIPVASAPERDQVFAAAQVDGMINETLVTALINKDQVRAQVVRYARTATRQDALFSIVASAKSGITGVEGLKGVEIGVSQATIIEYLTERLLQAQGFSPQDIKTISIPKIPDRINLLGTGELKAATLPEPPVTLAVMQGGKVVLDDRALPELSFSTITFRKDYIDQQSESLRGFLAAIEEAVALINAGPEKYGDLLVEQKVVPPQLAGKFKVPPFVTAGVPTEAQWSDMLAWAKDKKLLTQDVAYGTSVNTSFLPK